MAFFRGNLHAHTTFSDGVRSPQALIAEYESRGYDFLAITDHEDHENWVEPAYQRTLERLAPRLPLSRGIEVNFIPFEQHVGKVYSDTETLWVLNHPARYRLSVAETVARVDMIRAAGWPLDAIEVTETGMYRPTYDTDAIPATKIATDDAHRPPHFGRAWIEVDAQRDRERDDPRDPGRRRAHRLQRPLTAASASGSRVPAPTPGRPRQSGSTATGRRSTGRRAWISRAISSMWRVTIVC